MIRFFQEDHERQDIVIGQAELRVLAFQRLDHARLVIDAHAQLAIGHPQERATEVGDLARRRAAAQCLQLFVPVVIEQALFEVDASLAVRLLEQPLNLA